MKKVAIGAVIIAAFVASAFFVPFSRRLVFCSQLVNPYDLTRAFTVSVPPSGRAQFVGELADFLRGYGLGPSSGQMHITEVGNDANRYESLQTIACDGLVFVWSQDDLRPAQFGVTFHRNKLFSSDKASVMGRTFKAIFSRRYPVRDGVGWQPQAQP